MSNNTGDNEQTVPDVFFPAVDCSGGRERVHCCSVMVCVLVCSFCVWPTHTNKSYESCPSYMPYVRISFLQLLIFCLIHNIHYQTLQWKFVMAYFFFMTTVHTLAYQHICVNKTCVNELLILSSYRIFDS